ncbi:hypothetical protein Tco_1406284 [Tanacetum coccineum]
MKNPRVFSHFQRALCYTCMTFIMNLDCSCCVTLDQRYTVSVCSNLEDRSCDDRGTHRQIWYNRLSVRERETGSKEASMEPVYLVMCIEAVLVLITNPLSLLSACCRCAVSAALHRRVLFSLNSNVIAAYWAIVRRMVPVDPYGRGEMMERLMMWDSSRDDARDEDEDEEDEGGGGALNSAVLLPDYSSPSLHHISLSPPSAGERLARCMAPPAHSPPLPPSSGCLTQIQTLRIASTQALIDAVLCRIYTTSLLHYPPISSYDNQLVDRWMIFPRARQGIRDVGYGIRDTWVDPAEVVPEIAPMTVGEVNTRVVSMLSPRRGTQGLVLLTTRMLRDGDRMDGGGGGLCFPRGLGSFDRIEPGDSSGASDPS